MPIHGTLFARLVLRWLPGMVLLVSGFAYGATLQVGAGKTYQTIAAAVGAAQPGDTIAIDAGVYANETMTISKNDLTLRGVGGRAHLRWGTGNYLTNTATIGNGKGIFVISGNNVVIENLEFSGAKVVDENGAGIRYEGGNLTIRGSYFHHNENGILGQGGISNTLLIENSIFEQNGYCPVDCAHNVYIGRMGTFIFRYNKTIDSKIGHLLKSRANVTEVIGNFFSTKGGDGSYEANFPNGGTVYFIGNVVEQGVNTDNPQIIAYGEEGSTNPNPALHVVNNTFYNLRGSGGFFLISGTPALTVKNNIFAGGGSISVAVDSSNKVFATNASANFVNAAAGNYRLAAGSTAIDAAVNPGSAGTYSLAPQWEYVEPASSAARVTSGSAIDVGAYEFSSGTLPDTTPDAFGFTSQNGVAVSTAVTSNTITPAGYNAAAAIGVSAGGSYSINGGGFVSTAGTISPGQSVAVRQTSAAAFNTTTTLTLTIGGVAGTFAVSTQAATDTAPNAFGFTPQNGVAVGTVLTSNTITPAGYNAAAAISVSGGSYSINGGAFVTAVGVISPGQSVTLRLTSAPGNGIQSCANLNIGGVTGSFCATTVAGLPGAPTAISATAGAASITVRFAAPASNGGAALSGYAATCTSASGGVANTHTGGANATSIAVGALTVGKSYTCTVRASNAVGTGPASAPSNAVTPIALAPILDLLLND